MAGHVIGHRVTAFFSSFGREKERKGRESVTSASVDGSLPPSNTFHHQEIGEIPPGMMVVAAAFALSEAYAC